MVQVSWLSQWSSPLPSVIPYLLFASSHFYQSQILPVIKVIIQSYRIFSCALCCAISHHCHFSHTSNSYFSQFLFHSQSRFRPFLHSCSLVSACSHSTHYLPPFSFSSFGINFLLFLPRVPFLLPLCSVKCPIIICILRWTCTYPSHHTGHHVSR